MSDPLDWLARQTLYPKIYWSDRDATYEAVAIGDFGTCPTRYALHPFWGPTTRFIAPVEEHLSPGRTATPFPTLFSSHSRTETPDPLGWRKSVEQALDEIQAGLLSKVVLARRVTHQVNLDPLDLLRALRPHAQNRTLFFFQWSAQHAFLGATPERLFRRRNHIFETEALAGTDPFGEKEQREFEWVVQGIRESLPFPLTLGPLEHRASGPVTHLARTLHASLPLGTTDFELLASLHPTPAIAGWPRAPALEALLRYETFERDLYAGAVGRITRRDSDYCVAIRSAELAGDHLHLYSGAGIVTGSDPTLEWAELNRKIAPFECLLSSTN